MTNFDEIYITTYPPNCTYCTIVNKGYWHWTNALFYNEETNKALCRCTKRED